MPCKLASNSNGPFPNAPRATPATYINTNKPIKLSTQGSKIIDDFGREVILKGVVRPSLEWMEQGNGLSPQDIQNMANWKATDGSTAKSNAIRLDLNQMYWFASEDVSVQGSYKQIIDAIIYYATQNGMAVILDLHWTDHQGQSPMANQDSLTFWKEVATAYKDFGTVIFELFDEPNNIPKETWLNGDGNYVGYQQLYDAVRGTGADNLVIANGLDWGYQLDFVNDNFCVQGDNIIYGMHPYNDKGAPNYQGPGGSLDNNLKGILGEKPVISTEYGDDQLPDYNNNNYQPNYLRNTAYFNQHGISSTAFAWFPLDLVPNEPNFPVLINDLNNPQAILGGTIVQADMIQNPGTSFFDAPQNKMQMQTALLPAGFQGAPVVLPESRSSAPEISDFEMISSLDAYNELIQHKNELKNSFFAGKKYGILEAMTSKNTIHHLEPIFERNKSILGTHRNVFKRFFSAILPQSVSIFLFGKPKSLELAERLLNTVKVLKTNPTVVQSSHQPILSKLTSVVNRVENELDNIENNIEDTIFGALEVIDKGIGNAVKYVADKIEEAEEKVDREIQRLVM